jgi:hypothetical protein
MARRVLLRYLPAEDSCADLVMRPGCDVSVGRSSGADVTISRSFVAAGRKHFLLRLVRNPSNESDVEAVDNDSMNGLFVNGTRVQRARVQDGDIIQVGTSSERVPIGGKLSSHHRAAALELGAARNCKIAVKIVSTGNAAASSAIVGGQVAVFPTATLSECSNTNSVRTPASAVHTLKSLPQQQQSPPPQPPPSPPPSPSPSLQQPPPPVRHLSSQPHPPVVLLDTGRSCNDGGGSVSPGVSPVDQPKQSKVQNKRGSEVLVTATSAKRGQCMSEGAQVPNKKRRQDPQSPTVDFCSDLRTLSPSRRPPAAACTQWRHTNSTADIGAQVFCFEGASGLAAKKNVWYRSTVVGYHATRGHKLQYDDPRCPINGDNWEPELGDLATERYVCVCPPGSSAAERQAQIQHLQLGTSSEEDDDDDADTAAAAADSSGNGNADSECSAQSAPYSLRGTVDFCSDLRTLSPSRRPPAVACTQWRHTNSTADIGAQVFCFEGTNGLAAKKNVWYRSTVVGYHATRGHKLQYDDPRCQMDGENWEPELGDLATERYVCVRPPGSSATERQAQIQQLLQGNGGTSSGAAADDADDDDADDDDMDDREPSIRVGSEYQAKVPPLCLSSSASSSYMAHAKALSDSHRAGRTVWSSFSDGDLPELRTFLEKASQELSNLAVRHMQALSPALAKRDLLGHISQELLQTTSLSVLWEHQLDCSNALSSIRAMIDDGGPTSAQASKAKMVLSAPVFLKKDIDSFFAAVRRNGGEGLGDAPTLAKMAQALRKTPSELVSFYYSAKMKADTLRPRLRKACADEVLTSDEEEEVMPRKKR